MLLSEGPFGLVGAESLWPVAISGGTNGAPPWGVRPDIGTNAHWIWASSFTSTDEVWCRCTSGGHAYDDGLCKMTHKSMLRRFISCSQTIVSSVPY